MSLKPGSPLIYACTDEQQMEWLLKVRDYLLREKLIEDHVTLSMHNFLPWYLSDYPMHAVASKYAFKQFLDGLRSFPIINLNRPETYNLLLLGRGTRKTAMMEVCNPNSIIFHYEWWDKYSRELINSSEIVMDFKDLIKFEGNDYRYFVDGNRGARPYQYKFIRSL